MYSKEDLFNKLIKIKSTQRKVQFSLYIVLPFLSVMLFLIGSGINYELNIINISPFQFGIVYLSIQIIIYIIYLLKIKKFKTGIKNMLKCNELNNSNISNLIHYYKECDKPSLVQLMFYLLGILLYIVYFVL